MTYPNDLYSNSYELEPRASSRYDQFRFRRDDHYYGSRATTSSLYFDHFSYDEATPFTSARLERCPKSLVDLRQFGGGGGADDYEDRREELFFDDYLRREERRLYRSESQPTVGRVHYEKEYRLFGRDTVALIYYKTCYL